MTLNGTTSFNLRTSVRDNSIRWLILGGAFLMAATAIGTAAMVWNFRERALSSSKRELENTTLLLARQFDEKFENFAAIQRDIVAQIKIASVTSTDLFKSRMSTLEIHEVLRAKVTGHFDGAGVNVFDSEGTLINSTE